MDSGTRTKTCCLDLSIIAHFAWKKQVYRCADWQLLKCLDWNDFYLIYFLQLINLTFCNFKVIAKISLFNCPKNTKPFSLQWLKKEEKRSKSSHLQSCNHQMLTIVCCLVLSHYESVDRLWGSGRASPSGSLSFCGDLTHFTKSCGIYSEADIFLFLACSDYQTSPKRVIAYITI